MSVNCDCFFFKAYNKHVMKHLFLQFSADRMFCRNIWGMLGIFGCSPFLFLPLCPGLTAFPVFWVFPLISITTNQDFFRKSCIWWHSDCLNKNNPQISKNKSTCKWRNSYVSGWHCGLKRCLKSFKLSCIAWVCSSASCTNGTARPSPAPES